MSWYNPSTWESRDVVKLNPAQNIIAQAEGSIVYTDTSLSYYQAFEKIETVNRGVNMIVSACAGLDFDVKESKPGVIKNMRSKALVNLLNFSPNPYQSQQEFRTHIFTDFLLEGNIFLYWDGVHLYHLPASQVQVVPDSKTFVKEYTYNGGEQKFTPEEIIHIKDLSAASIYRGSSRLSAAARNIKIMYKMQEFQESFFDNGALTGIIITTDNSLSTQAKEKTQAYWQTKYSLKNGAKRPIILDNGLKPHSLGENNFKDMDFDNSIKTHDTKILKALGVPSLLLDGGNNANISPNLRLFYLETILPIVIKYVSGIERFFGYDVSPVTANVSALQPELKDLAAYYTTLVNGGIIKPNEAREELRYEKVKDADAEKLRVPANIAGSAGDPSQGGRPPAPKPATSEPKE